MRYSFFLLLVVESLFISSHAEELNSIPSESLKLCISDYRDGYYGRTVECIDQVLPSLTTFRDSVESYKMLALSYGMINQIENAKKYFGIALQKDSTMDIDTLAFPPNIALIYNQVKLEKKMSRIDVTSSPQPVLIHKKEKNGPATALLLSSVVLSTGGAVYLYYNGYLARDKYSSLGNDQKMLDKTWKEYTYSIAGGVGCTVISGVTTWLFFRVINRNAALSVSGNENGVAVVYKF
jgi:hypothetical protein